MRQALGSICEPLNPIQRAVAVLGCMQGQGTDKREHFMFPIPLAEGGGRGGRLFVEDIVPGQWSVVTR